MRSSMLRMYTLIISALLLSACTTTPPPPPPVVLKPTLEPAPAWMTNQCPAPKMLPRKELSQAEAEKQWAEDLRLYHECRTKHAAHVRWVKERDEAVNKGYGQ